MRIQNDTFTLLSRHQSIKEKNDINILSPVHLKPFTLHPLIELFQ